MGILKGKKETKDAKFSFEPDLENLSNILKKKTHFFFFFIIKDP